MKTVTEASHEFLKPALHPWAVCIDATLGRGNDSAFFLEQGVKKVYAFDVQQPLTEMARKRFAPESFEALCAGHEHMAEVLKLEKESVDAVIFNFGYDPKTMEGVHTMAVTSQSAVQQALELLRPRGRMALVFYPHPEGVLEAERIVSDLCQRPDVSMYSLKNPKAAHSPWALLVEKKKLRKG